MGDLSWWLEVKRWLVELVALERDALHIYFAIGIYLATVRLTRLRLSDPAALLALVALELLNEFIDLRYEVWPGRDRDLQWWASAHDVLNTLAVPAIIMLVARHEQRRGGTASAPLDQLHHDQGEQREHQDPPPP